MAWRKLTKQPWEAIRVHLPQPKASPRGGRPRVDDRRCCAGLLWILWTGANGVSCRSDMAALAPAGGG
jgi:transposase